MRRYKPRLAKDSIPLYNFSLRYFLMSTDLSRLIRNRVIYSRCKANPQLIVPVTISLKYSNSIFTSIYIFKNIFIFRILLFCNR